ncbi:MAG: cobalamin B12-binding domain-containing protein [Planctomycetota bacterium]
MKTSTPGLARLAAESLLSRLDAPERFGADAQSIWRDHLASRIEDLSLAIGRGQPGLFTDQTGWTRATLASRGFPEADLRQSLQCLRDVLHDELPADAAAPALRCLDDTLAGWDALPGVDASTLSADTPNGKLAARFVLALLEGDRRRACDLVTDAIRAGEVSTRDAILEVCLPAERELGRMWQLDEITVAEEHFISSTVVSLVARIVALAPPVAELGKTVVAATLENDAHDIGMQAVCALYEMDGWRLVSLGSGLPVDDLVWSVDAFGADLVLLSAALVRHVDALGAAVARVRARPGADGAAARAVPVLVGGPAFAWNQDLWKETGADAFAADARSAVSVGRELVGL